jgi:hypothetical protein
MDGIATHLIHADRKSRLARIILTPAPRLSIDAKGTGVKSSRHDTREADISRGDHGRGGRHRRRVGSDLAGVGPAPAEGQTVGIDPAGMMTAD